MKRLLAVTLILAFAPASAPLIAYEESASKGPGLFLGGAKVEYYPSALSGGFYSTSLGISLLAGAADINDDPDFTAQINAELDANAVLFPSFTVAVGPMLFFRL
jgi:hypothetical protein